jgi:hypothetical protein
LTKFSFFFIRRSDHFWRTDKPVNDEPIMLCCRVSGFAMNFSVYHWLLSFALDFLLKAGLFFCLVFSRWAPRLSRYVVCLSLLDVSFFYCSLLPALSLYLIWRVP